MKIQCNTDILFINVPLDRTLHSRKDYSLTVSMPPIGMLYIIGSLENAGFTVSFIDFTVEMFDKNEFMICLHKMQPKIVAFSSYVESWNIQNAFAKNIKAMCPESIVVAGGYCATFTYEEMLSTKNFDYIVRWEGEFAYVLLCRYLILHMGSIKDIKNLVYFDNGDIIINDYERILEIDDLPFPARDALDMDKYSYPFTISTARGCPGECIFCSANGFWGRNVVMRSPKNIIKEIDEVFQRFGTKDFFIIDDTFTLNTNRTLEFCELLNELAQKHNVDFVWGCESRVDVIRENDQILAKMKQAGCNMIQFGMESGNDDVLKSLKKNITYSQVYLAVKKAYEMGMNINVSFMIGHHSDTIETIMETLEKAVELKEKFHANMVFSINTPYPGTELRKNLSKFGVTLIEDDFSRLKTNDTAIRTSNLSANDIRKAFYMAISMLYS